MIHKLREIPKKLRLAYKCIQGPYFKWVGPGHFYSPLPDMGEIKRRELQIYGKPPAHLVGINLSTEEQTRFLSEITRYASDMPFDRGHNPQSRFTWPNGGAYPFQDAFVLYSMIRRYNPARFVEVGCGYSTCVTLDACQGLSLNTALTMIEPYPEWMQRSVKASDSSRYTFRQECIQDTPMNIFTDLAANDILFIDTSHVSKTGSDVNHIFFNILPRLKPGVLVHFHDIFYPFEYPIDWLQKGMFWNETYLLRAFLMHNSDFEIILFNNYISQFHTEIVKNNFPQFLEDEPGTSLWIRRKL